MTNENIKAKKHTKGLNSPCHLILSNGLPP